MNVNLRTPSVKSRSVTRSVSINPIFIFTILLTSLLIFAAFNLQVDTVSGQANQATSQGQIHIVIDDTTLETPGRLSNGRTMVPLRGVFEQMGASVDWDEEDSLITIIRDWDRVELTPGEKTAHMNYEETELDEAPFTSRGTTWLPLRAISELFELEVEWEDEYDLVRITTGDEDKSTGEIAEALEPIEVEETGDQTVHLTFDDGPSELSSEVLDILNEYDAQATFFVIGKQAEAMPETIRRIDNEGHLLANHSYTHDYDQVYESTEAFEEEVVKTEEVIQDITGERTTLFRPPGGSYPNMTDEKEEVLEEHGYTTHNWSVSSGDTATPPPSAEIIRDNVVEGVRESSGAVVLMHDASGNETTVEALPEILEKLSFDGYEFKTLPH